MVSVVEVDGVGEQITGHELPLCLGCGGLEESFVWIPVNFVEEFSLPAAWSFGSMISCIRSPVSGSPCRIAVNAKDEHHVHALGSLELFLRVRDLRDVLG